MLDDELSEFIGFTEGDDLILQDRTDLAVENLLDNTNEDPEFNDSNVDTMDFEDEEDVDAISEDEEDLVDLQNLFVEETNELNRRMHEVLPVYDTLPEGYNADADSFPYSGQVYLDTFDGERDELRRGMLFKDKSELQLAVKEWSIRNNRQFTVRKGATSKTVWEVYCTMRDTMQCPWKLRGSMQKRKSGYWEIVTLTPNHTCLFSTFENDHRNLNSCLIVRAIAHLVEVDPSIKISMIVAEIEKDYKITIAYSKAWYAKQKVIAEIYGDWKESYARLPQLFLAMKKTNPGTVVNIKKSEPDPVTNESQLIRIFWAFGPAIEGFRYCRPVMSIYSTHLYGKYKGNILIALGVDGNGQIYPVAYALVQQETKANWGWFLMKLRSTIGPRPDLCLISDRHASIIAAVKEPINGWAAPMATHRFCLRHVRSNFMAKFHNATLKLLVWNIGSEVEKHKFAQKMLELKSLHVDAWKWCKKIPKEEWSLAYDGGHRYGCMTTNLVECFNGVLLAGRNLPVCAMVMLMFHRQVRYFIDKRNNYTRMTLFNQHNITDKGVQLCEASRDDARFLRLGNVYDPRRGIATILSNLGNTYPVDISMRTCICGSWSHYKVPCGHAMKAMMALNFDYMSYVDPLYRLDAYRSTYEPQFYPLDHRAYWPTYTGPTLIPLVGTLRSVGRPRSRRFRNEMDESASVQQKLCSKCRQPGHTIRTCKSPSSSSMPHHQ